MPRVMISECKRIAVEAVCRAGLEVGRWLGTAQDHACVRYRVFAEAGVGIAETPVCLDRVGVEPTFLLHQHERPARREPSVQAVDCPRSNLQSRRRVEQPSVVELADQETAAIGAEFDGDGARVPAVFGARPQSATRELPQVQHTANLVRGQEAAVRTEGRDHDVFAWVRPAVQPRHHDTFDGIPGLQIPVTGSCQHECRATDRPCTFVTLVDITQPLCERKRSMDGDQNLAVRCDFNVPLAKLVTQLLQHGLAGRQRYGRSNAAPLGLDCGIRCLQRFDPAVQVAPLPCAP